jgi:hypothetical protein
MYIFAGIDGTGESNDAEYARSFRNSFVKGFTSGLQPPNVGQYQRGPTTEGSSTEPKGASAAKFVADSLKSNQFKGKQPGVFLTGFSRGGASAIHACKVLAENKISVDALFLFDAVDRAVGIDADEIPTNVRIVHHATRGPNTDSRGVFGNCGLRYFPSHTTYNIKSFYCTHGAMGGTPWTQAGWDGKIYEDHVPVSKGMIILLGAATGTLPAAASYVRSLRTNVTIEQERAGSAAVHAWMTKNLGDEIARVKSRQATG